MIAVEVARGNAHHISLLPGIHLAAARVPPLLPYLGIILVVDKEVGLPWECHLAVLLAFSGRIGALDSVAVIQRIGVGTPVLDVLHNVAFLSLERERTQ